MDFWQHISRGDMTGQGKGWNMEKTTSTVIDEKRGHDLNKMTEDMKRAYVS